MKGTTLQIVSETCSCSVCLESENPCHFDCSDPEMLCDGCYESKQGENEEYFDIYTSQGGK